MGPFGLGTNMDAMSLKDQVCGSPMGVIPEEEALFKGPPGSSTTHQLLSHELRLWKIPELTALVSASHPPLLVGITIPVYCCGGQSLGSVNSDACPPCLGKLFNSLGSLLP